MTKKSFILSKEEGLEKNMRNMRTTNFELYAVFLSFNQIFHNKNIQLTS